MIKNAKSLTAAITPLACTMMLLVLVFPHFGSPIHAWSADVGGARDSEERVCRNGAQNIYDVLYGLAESAKETSERAADKALETAIQSLGNRETNPFYDVDREDALKAYNDAMSSAETTYRDSVLSAASLATAELGNCDREYNARERERAEAEAARRDEEEDDYSEDEEENEHEDAINREYGSNDDQFEDNFDNDPVDLDDLIDDLLDDLEQLEEL